MKKSMLTLVGCALAASTVMAAEVVGNNTAVVIQKDAEVSSNYFQFLIVPVKGFDITGAGQGEAQPLLLSEVLPPSVYGTGTIVYKAASPEAIYIVQPDGWEYLNAVKVGEDTIIAAGTDADNVSLNAQDILWMQTDGDPDVPDTVFCGELTTNAVTVTPVSGQFVAFGNATSLAISVAAVNAGTTPLHGDEIYLVKPGTYDYYRYFYNENKKCWTKPPVGSGSYVEIAETDVIAPGTAAYYYRRPSSTN